MCPGILPRTINSTKVYVTTAFLTTTTRGMGVVVRGRGKACSAHGFRTQSPLRSLALYFIRGFTITASALFLSISPFLLFHRLFSFFLVSFIFFFSISPLQALSGHFASLVVSKKVPATYGDFDFFFSKIPPILKLEVGFFSDKKSFSKIDQICEDLFFIN